jgi:hypothetical protein
MFLHLPLAGCLSGWLVQEAEEAEDGRQAGEAARQAAIVQAERERMLRGAAHLKGAMLPKGLVQVGQPSC